MKNEKDHQENKFNHLFDEENVTFKDGFVL
jgi:hypothetical protein